MASSRQKKPFVFKKLMKIGNLTSSTNALTKSSSGFMSARNRNNKSTFRDNYFSTTSLSNHYNENDIDEASLKLR